METIKIKFVDMPSEFDINNNFILDILKKRYCVVFSDKPDFLIYSVFGIEYLAYRDCVRIFMDGEPILPNFNDCDYAIGYAYFEFGDRYFRAATILASSIGKEIPPTIQDRSCITDDLADRRFCNFIYSNAKLGDGAQLRQEFCKELMKYKKVDCPGKVLNNMSTDELSIRLVNKESEPVVVLDNSWQTSKQEFQKRYKFSISFENMCIPGMTTEKLLNPFFAYSIPIYWGNPEVTREYNPKSFINCHDYNNDFHAIIEKVKELDSDDKKYLAMLREPPMRESFDFNQMEKLESYFYMIIDRGNHPVRNPCAVDCWEPISANLVLRWGDSYQAVHDAICDQDSNTWKLVRKLQKFGDSRWGYLPKKAFHFAIRVYKKIKRLMGKEGR